MNEQFLVLWSVSNPKMERCTQLVYRERSEEKVAFTLGRFNPLSLTSHSPLGSLFSIWESVLACRNKGEEGSEKLGVHLDFFHFFVLLLQSWRTFLIQFSPVLIARKNNNHLPVRIYPTHHCLMPKEQHQLWIFISLIMCQWTLPLVVSSCESVFCCCCCVYPYKHHQHLKSSHTHTQIDCYKDEAWTTCLSLSRRVPMVNNNKRNTFQFISHEKIPL